MEHAVTLQPDIPACVEVGAASDLTPVSKPPDICLFTGTHDTRRL
jgi:hypothetical protein